MRKQRGFGLLVYLIAGGIILAMLSGLAYKIRESGYDKAVSEYKPQVIASQQQISALGSQIEVQNRAVAALKAEGEARVAKAKAGLVSASKVALGAQQEAARLRTEAAKGSGKACPAGEAVEKIRNGLKTNPSGLSKNDLR